MIGFAANDAAQRDHAVVRRAGPFGGVEQDRGGGGNLQRAGRARNRPARLRFRERLGRALQQHFADGLVKLRFDDQKMRASDGCLHVWRSAWLRHGDFLCTRKGELHRTSAVAAQHLMLAQQAGSRRGGGAAPAFPVGFENEDGELRRKDAPVR